MKCALTVYLFLAAKLVSYATDDIEEDSESETEEDEEEEEVKSHESSQEHGKGVVEVTLLLYSTQNLLVFSEVFMLSTDSRNSETCAELSKK